MTLNIRRKKLSNINFGILFVIGITFINRLSPENKKHFLLTGKQIDEGKQHFISVFVIFLYDSAIIDRGRNKISLVVKGCMRGTVPFHGTTSNLYERKGLSCSRARKTYELSDFFKNPVFKNKSWLGGCNIWWQNRTYLSSDLSRGDLSRLPLGNKNWIWRRSPVVCLRGKTFLPQLSRTNFILRYLCYKFVFVVQSLVRFVVLICNNISTISFSSNVLTTDMELEYFALANSYNQMRKCNLQLWRGFLINDLFNVLC